MSKEAKRWKRSQLEYMHPEHEVVDAKAYDSLLEENKKLRQMTSEKVVSSTMLREFVAHNGGLTIGLEGGACALMAQAFGQQLYESDALNYIEASFDSPDYPDLGQITVTLKRETGKTPHQLRKEAEAERDALLAERDRLRETLEAQSWELASPNISYALRDQLLGQLAGDHEPEEILCVEDFYSWLANAIDNIRAEHRKAEGGQPMQVRASALQGARP